MRVNLQQNTPEWLAFRKDKIGASEISSILGISPWVSKRTLWRRKMDLEPEQPDNEHMRRGRELEHEARDLFCKITCSCLEPEVHQSDSHPFAIASLDGINLDGDEILEIKCPNSPPGEDIPKHYYAQMQWQLMVSGAKLCHYVVYFDGDIRSWKVERDETFIAKSLEAAIDFRESMIQFQEPESDKPVLNEITCKQSLYRLDRYGELCSKKEEIDREMEELRPLIIADAKGQACKGGGFKVMPIEREGPVDYSKIPELKGVDLDKYRKSKSFFWTIKKEK